MFYVDIMFCVAIMFYVDIMFYADIMFYVDIRYNFISEVEDKVLLLSHLVSIQHKHKTAQILCLVYCFEDKASSKDNSNILK